MITFKCKMCGGELNITEGSNICECESCGTQQTIPSADNEKKINLFNRANRLRINAEFDKAATVYASITAEFPEEAEAYWGLCLCKYGIEYVDDPLAGKKIPTCHRTLTISILDDSDFDQACENADAESKRLYREDAKAIDRLQQDILRIVASEEPFDVFICYKETNEDGERTDDSVLAQDIYDFLTEKGLKVFFARISLEDKLGKQYEPYIYAALHSAKVMLAVGTKYEYFDAVWVKNEWARFLDMMKSDKSKSLIPCYKGIDAYDMPREFKNLQALDMGKIGWKQDLVRGIKKLTAKEEKPKQETVQTIVSAGANVGNLMKRVRLFLEDGNFSGANEYIEKVLDENAEYAPAYVAKVCVAMQLCREEDLAEAPNIYIDFPDWKKAIRFATEQQKNVYEDYIASTIIQIVKHNLTENLSVSGCQRAIQQLEKYSGFQKIEHQIREIKAIEEELIRREEAEKNKLIEEETRRKEEELKKLQDKEYQHMLRLADARKKIETIKQAFYSKQNEYESIKRQKTEYYAQRRETELQIERSREKVRMLLDEELKASGRMPGKRRNEIAARRKEEEVIQDRLRKQLAESERKYLAERKSFDAKEINEDDLIYSIAKTYYEYQLYPEALKEYREIPDYKDVEVLISQDPHLQEAAEK